MKRLAERLDTLEVPEGQAAIGWLGQGSFVFKTSGGTLIYLDPYLSHGLESRLGWKRWFAPPILPEEVRADMVIVTHNHLDHIDPDTVPGLVAQAQNAETVFVGPQSCLDALVELGVRREQTVLLEAGQNVSVLGIPLRASHADHMHPSDPTPDAISVWLELNGVSVLNAADTTYRSEVISEVRGSRPDVVLVPINGRWGNMDGTDAAQYVRDVEARLVMPMHYGLMSANTADPREFLDAMHAFAPKTPVHLIGYGEVYLAGKG